MSGGVAMGQEAITINESLPVVSISSKPMDKACFGVIAGLEDSNNRTYSSGNFVSVIPRENGDVRVHVNSLGEGAMWITNENGPLESGDYITSSSTAGYGQKQDAPQLCNYTVAKITMDCDFNPPMVPKMTMSDEIDETTGLLKLISADGQEPAYRVKDLGNGLVAAFVGVTYHCG